ncbi:carboxypeptidase regulatory-like domain-containing protein [Chryseobacterium sp. M5A1_1a]
MKIILIFIGLFVSEILFSQQTVTGIITDESGIGLSSVMVINISANTKIFSNSLGGFSIGASKNDELRFILSGYERLSKIVIEDHQNALLPIILFKVTKEIEEVKVYKKLTGDLSKDSKILTKVDQGKIIQKAVGLPQPVGKMREKPAEVKEVLLPMLFGNLNVQGMYDLISGKARKQKRIYNYEDLQEDIAWIRSRVEDDYFVKIGIPKDKISEFIEFSFYTNLQIRRYVKVKSLSGAVLGFEDIIPIYLEKVKKE